MRSFVSSIHCSSATFAFFVCFVVFLSFSASLLLPLASRSPCTSQLNCNSIHAAQSLFSDSKIKRKLTRSSISDTVAMATSSWRELLQQAMQSHKHLKHHTHLQLATVRPDGRPANRTLVFRGFVEGTDKLQFTTDSRTHKIDDIKHCPFGEICYYFTDSWEQFRIHGILDLIGHADSDSARKSLREKAWFDSSPKARSGFAVPHPGTPKSSESSDAPQVDPDQGPLDTFCVLTLEPEEIDYYHAKDVVRVLFKSSNTKTGQKVWSQHELNP